MQKKKKLVRITTAPMALAYPLSGQPTFMQNNCIDVTMISSGGIELPRLLKNEGCPHILVPLTRRITPLRDIHALITLVRIFRKIKPDIVHTETPKAGLLGMIAAYLCGINIRIHTVAGLPLMVEKGLKLKLLEFIEKVTYSAATNVWPNSFSLKNFIINHNLVPESKLKVIGKGSSNGINLKRFTAKNLDENKLKKIKAQIDYNEKNLYMLFVGRLVRDKGIIELVGAFSDLQKSQTHLRLILVGQYERSLDPLPSEIESEIKTNPAITHISWTDDVEYYMAFSNYFIFPSYREGFPNVLLEAGAMGLPIVCSNIAGNIDIVTDKETGFLFETQSKSSLKEVMLNAMQQSSFSLEMSNRLKSRIITNYDREKFWEMILKEYNILFDQTTTNQQ
ncbi:MAG: glycosyltransferase family 4 protein [Ginsengibacter sp.]